MEGVEREGTRRRGSAGREGQTEREEEGKATYKGKAKNLVRKKRESRRAEEIVANFQFIGR